jgi:hypothetical protein
MGLSRRWVTGGAVYTLMIVLALVLRLSAQVHVPKDIYSMAVAVSDFGTLPPLFAGIGLYAGQVAGYTVQDWTGLPDSSPLLLGTVWALTVLWAAAVAVADVYLAHGICGFARRHADRLRRRRSEALT